MYTMQQSEADIAVCDYVQGCDTDFNWNENDIVNDFTLFDGKTFLYNCIIGKTGKHWVLWDKLYKKKCFDDIRLPEGRIYEDNATVYKLIYMANKVTYSNNVLYYYFTNPESTVNKDFSVKRLDRLIFIQEMIEFFTENDEKELLDWANRYYLFTIADLYIKANKSNLDSSILKELKRKLKSHYHQEKVKYPITIKTYPQVFEVLHPKYSKYYWLFKALVNKIRRC